MKRLLIYIVCASILHSCASSQFSKLRQKHVPADLSDDDLRNLARLSDPAHIDEVLDNILVPRVVGTAAHTNVSRYIIDELGKLNWNVELDEFEARTPIFGKLKFRNIIATLNPNAERYLVLACHYDSKYFANEYFVGAIDSAVPCAMMLNLVKVMREELRALCERNDLNLKLIFFDGEEAFVEWGPNDSIYGAKHLAEKYHKTRVLLKSTGETVSELQRIDILVLLDLLGTPNPAFYSSFRNTDKWYVRMVAAEERLADLGELERHTGRYFRAQSTGNYVEDDHTPFMQRKVPIVHLIASPFPKSWHTPDDNRESVDMTTVENLNKILRVFVAEYLHLSV